MTAPFLSVIIPAHNEEHRLPRTLRQVWEFLRAAPYAWEVIVVENGSADRTLEVARCFAADHAGVHVLQLASAGKGGAVRAGMLAARGDYRFMCDADLSMPIEQLTRFLPPARPDCDIAIASREAPGAARHGEPLYRHLGGRLINLAIRLLALPGLNDTQCGFKCLRAAAAEDLFPRLTLTGWSFDIELLYLARRRGWSIAEVPIDWHYNPESKLNAVRDALRMLRDILIVRRNARRGRYDDPSA